MNQLLKLLAVFAAVIPVANADVTTPIACNLAVFTKAERARHIQLIAMLKDRVAEMRESTDGYSFRFDAELVRPLAEWTALETKCCPSWISRSSWSRNREALRGSACAVIRK